MARVGGQPVLEGALLAAGRRALVATQPPVDGHGVDRLGNGSLIVGHGGGALLLIHSTRERPEKDVRSQNHSSASQQRASAMRICFCAMLRDMPSLEAMAPRSSPSSCRARTPRGSAAAAPEWRRGRAAISPLPPFARAVSIPARARRPTARARTASPLRPWRARNRGRESSRSSAGRAAARPPPRPRSAR